MDIPILKFNYPRNLPPRVGVHVDRIVFPLKLPTHTVYILSQVDIEGMPFQVAKHYMPALKKTLYVCRKDLTCLSSRRKWKSRKGWR